MRRLMLLGLLLLTGSVFAQQRPADAPDAAEPPPLRAVPREAVESQLNTIVLLPIKWMRSSAQARTARDNTIRSVS